MGANLQYKGLQEVLASIVTKKSAPAKEVSTKEASKDWKRLAVFMSGRN